MVTEMRRDCSTCGSVTVVMHFPVGVRDAALACRIAGAVAPGGAK